MDAFVIANRVGLGQAVSAAIDTAVDPAPLNRVCRISPFTLHPFEIGQTRAVLELVDHPRWHVWLIVCSRWGRQRQFGLQVHLRFSPYQPLELLIPPQTLRARNGSQ